MSIRDVQGALVDLLKEVSWEDSQGNTRSFDKVAQHEPEKSPGKGVYAALWFDDIRPVAEMSSLATTAMVYTYLVRMYRSVNVSPGDSIDPDLVAALDAVMFGLIEDHRLGDTVYTVDILGAHSGGLQAATDYVDFGANAWYRVIDLTLPIVIEGVASYG
jgi:hypothetical protein